MRLNKYRAWHRKSKQMASWEDINVMDQEGIYPFLTMLDEDLYEVMQWTGLQDKNGVDVYEGDIVRCTIGCPHAVEWVKEYGGTFCGGMPAFYLAGLNNGYAWTGEEEIIGNIYENPELAGEGHESR